MPPAPVISQETYEYERYYVCKRHLKKRRTITEKYIRTYGMCPCYFRCGGSHEGDWRICVDGHGNGRCDGPKCNHFYLNNEEGYIDEGGNCFYVEDGEPVLSCDGVQIQLPPSTSSQPPRRPKSRTYRSGQHSPASSLTDTS